MHHEQDFSCKKSPVWWTGSCEEDTAQTLMGTGQAPRTSVQSVVPTALWVSCSQLETFGQEQPDVQS